ncbi:hypothetical protein LBMAG27_13560 [Bacteroidota bacterium]|nr:hypothetical protein LBMAG27_13560 [Bacteroidota bacterium]
MNRTITINLSGIVFHIDENAYDKLKQYLEKLKSHFSSTQGNDEIIHDIESRIAEMFSEKVSEAKNVITLDEVNAVIEAMGNPEEVAGAESTQQSSQSSSQSSSSSSTTGTTYTTSGNKRFYRNVDEKVFGGVCSGIAAYFDFDPIWLRLAFALSFFFAGTGLILYLILWLIIPAARTTAEKLEMRGERVNISNIEKNIREEMNNVKDRVQEFGKEMNSENTRQKIRNNSARVGSFIGEVFTRVFQVIGKIFGFFITLISIALLVGLTIAVFSLFGVFSFALPAVFTHMLFSNVDLGWLITGSILVVGIPLVLLLLNGIRILFNVNLHLKSVGLVMLIFWLAGVGMATYQGVKLGKEFAKEGSNREATTLTMVGDTLKLDVSPNRIEWREKEKEYSEFFHGIYLTDKEDSLYIRTVSLDIQPSKTDSAELVIIRRSRGSTSMEARNLAGETEYHYVMSGNTLTLSPVCLIETDNKFRGQNVDMILKLPVGKSVYLEKDARMILSDVQNTTDTYDWEMGGHTWLMTKDGLECKDFSNDQPKKKKRIHGINYEINVD